MKKAVRNYYPEDKKPEAFRTMAGLTKTMNHLRTVMDWTEEDHPAANQHSIHLFLWDRYREVRGPVQANHAFAY